MSDGPGESSSSKGTPVVSAKARVVRACERFDVMENCTTAKVAAECSYPEIGDKAAWARSHAQNVESRLTKMEDLLDKFTPMAEYFQQWALAQQQQQQGGVMPTTPFPPLLQMQPQQHQQQQQWSEPQSSGNTPPFLHSLPPHHQQQQPGMTKAQGKMREPPLPPPPPPSTTVTPATTAAENPEGDIDVEEGKMPSVRNGFSFMASDSVGQMRYLGGATNFVLMEALAFLDHPVPASTPPTATAQKNANLDLPFFRPGRSFRTLAVLPNPLDVDFPEAGYADLLISTYFTKIHFSFPILVRSRFLASYATLQAHRRSRDPAVDSAFLSVLFAVFAVSSAYLNKEWVERHGVGVLGEEGEGFEGAGGEFYERALVLHFMSARNPRMSHVQCLALLSMWLSSVNTLAQAYILSGTAIRVAQDLGLHRSPSRLQGIDWVEKEERRRVFWCLYTLERSIAISLGRPFGIDDADCDVELPKEIDEDALEKIVDSGGEAGKEGDECVPNYMVGFTALCRINRAVSRVYKSAHSLERLRDISDPAKDTELRALVQALDDELQLWNDTLPECLQSSSASLGDRELAALTLVCYFVYFSGIIALHRPFIPSLQSSAKHNTAFIHHLGRCVGAARNLVKMGDLIQSYIPPSHYLSSMIQSLTMAAVILLRLVAYSNSQQLIEGVQQDGLKAASALEGLESIWSGASRCKTIIQELVKAVGVKKAGPVPSKESSTSNPLKRKTSAAGYQEEGDGRSTKFRAAADGTTPLSTTTSQQPYTGAAGSVATGLSPPILLSATQQPSPYAITPQFTPFTTFTTTPTASTSPPPRGPSTLTNLQTSSTDTFNPLYAYDFAFAHLPQQGDFFDLAGDDLPPVVSPTREVDYQKNNELLWDVFEDNMTYAFV